MERFSVFSRTWEIGATFRDTTARYGENEALIGKWLNQYFERRQDVFIVTESGFNAEVGEDGKVASEIKSIAYMGTANTAARRVHATPVENHSQSLEKYRTKPSGIHTCCM